MRLALALSRAIDAATAWMGRWLAWLIVLAALVSATNAIIRKLFDTSSNAWLELQWVLFGVVFLLCAPWTLAQNEHIRIDIVNNVLPRWARNAIEIVGHTLFLLPVCAVMVYTSLPFFLTSYRFNEQSPNAGGLPQWPAKAIIPIAFAILFIQGISELIKRIAIIRGDLEDTASGSGHHAAAEAEAKRLLEQTGEPGK